MHFRESSYYPGQFREGEFFSLFDEKADVTRTFLKKGKIILNYNRKKRKGGGAACEIWEGEFIEFEWKLKEGMRDIKDERKFLVEANLQKKGEMLRKKSLFARTLARDFMPVMG